LTILSKTSSLIQNLQEQKVREEKIRTFGESRIVYEVIT